MDGKSLEIGINEKYGKNSNHKIDENLSLIRKHETGEIVVLDSKSSANGHHLLKDASPEEVEKISAYFKKRTEEGDPEEENPFIPGTPDPPLTPLQEREETQKSSGGRRAENDNDMIPD